MVGKVWLHLHVCASFKHTHACAGDLQDKSMCTASCGGEEVHSASVLASTWCCNKSCCCTNIVVVRHGLLYISCFLWPHAFWCAQANVGASVQMPSTQDAELEPELLARVRSLKASRDLQLSHPLRQVAIDLHPDRPWNDLLGRHNEYADLLEWVVSNPGEQCLQTHKHTPYSKSAVGPGNQRFAATAYAGHAVGRTVAWYAQ